MNILAIGDIVGKNGRDYLVQNLWKYRQANQIGLVVANGENVCTGSGNGIDPESASALLSAGVDVLTGGNHTFRRFDFYNMLDDCSHVLRPANYPADAPGCGDCVIEVEGVRVLVMNVMGTMYTQSLTCPFETVDRILARRAGEYEIAVLDIHAEATAEKAALAYYFDGRIHAIFGTHTHVQTNDAQILPKGTGFLTDLGMTGPVHSVLGITTDVAIRQMKSKLPTKFVLADGKVEAQGAIYRLNAQNTRIEMVENVKF